MKISLRQQTTVVCVTHLHRDVRVGQFLYANHLNTVTFHLKVAIYKYIYTYIYTHIHIVTCISIWTLFCSVICHMSTYVQFFPFTLFPWLPSSLVLVQLSFVISYVIHLCISLLISSCIFTLRSPSFLAGLRSCWDISVCACLDFCQPSF